MSRLIVKNLPKDLTEDKFREHFASKGQVTDAKLMKTSWGASRKFGFIGYLTESAAQAALNHFNNSFINMSKITVEVAIPYGSDTLPRAWSRYTEGTTAHDRINDVKKTNPAFQVEETDAFKAKQAKLSKHVNELQEAEEKDSKLREYLNVMTARSKSKTWANDDISPMNTQEKGEEDEDSVMATIASNPDDDLYDDLPAKKAERDTIEDSLDEIMEEVDEESEDSPKKRERKQATSSDSEMKQSEQVEEKREEKEEIVNPRDQIHDTGRLFVRNLAYTCTENDLKELFSPFGPISEIHLPIAKDTKRSKGFAYILYLMPEHAIRAYESLDMKFFQGRLLHVLPSKEKPAPKEDEFFGPNGTKLSSVKKEKEKKRRNLATNDFNWNSLYMSSDAIAASIADRLGVSKLEVLNPEADNVAVRLALAETQIVAETKEFFEKHGIVLDTFGSKERSDTVILVKNIPFGTSEEELRSLFGKFGELGRVLIPPAKTMAVVEFIETNEARNAFKGLAYRRFKDSVVYLEKAPKGLFRDTLDLKAVQKSAEENTAKKAAAADLVESSSTKDDDEALATLFVKNLNFSTSVETFRKLFVNIEGYRSSRINVKPDAKNPGKTLSMGFGFVEFNTKENAAKALGAMQGYTLDGHSLEIKFSNHGAAKPSSTKAETTKLVIRNVPFEATSKDLTELFGTYGQLKSVRLPKKFSGGHRGFAFLDFMTKQEAKNVYDNMANIHLYGRHLVLEWAEEEEGIDSLREKTGKHYAKEMSHGRNAKKSRVDLDGAEDDILE
ncbi:hypothetical protein BDF14DRAFT_1757779 [Spinellus fusiger]|nr:hypothetical protein BDF14DRAFT_1757779 [Spinellus fusiger]